MRKLCLAASVAVLALSCSAGPNMETAPISVIPEPESIIREGAGSFDISNARFVLDGFEKLRGLQNVVAPEAPEAALATNAIETFASDLARISGGRAKVVSCCGSAHFVCDPSLEDEEYSINISKNKLQVRASTPNGFLYAIQTLKQMLPAAIYGSEPKPQECWSFPLVSISDKPRYAYRGGMLDVGRHFFSIEEVEKFIDVLALHKCNYFHWHLSEDQGWRIEIKKYPLLTEVGSIRTETLIGVNYGERPFEYDGTPYGGFYTQDQARHIVAYAAERGITVIPEIDLPGHMQSALASYPYLGCSKGPYEVRKRCGVSPLVLCAGRETTYQFIEDVLSEILDIFPSKYINIGGDECPREEWEKCPDCQAKIRELGLEDDENHSAETYLQNYVTARVQKFLNERGRMVIGWDEILEGKLAEGATVMSWRGPEGGIEAAKQGFDAIMSPCDFLYLNFMNSNRYGIEPDGFYTVLPIEKVYSYDPLEGIPEQARSHIIGVQANLWTEFISTPEHLEYMLLPRFAAVSELQWCRVKDFDRFRASLDHIREIYDALGYNYSEVVWGKYGMDKISE